jgi:AraC-like DNA-binding protein
MVLSILPAFARPDAKDFLHVDYVTLGLITHIAQTLGGMKVPQATSRSELAPWQFRKAKEILAAHMDENISISQLAAECNLSRSHFARAFKRSAGMSPHHWLVDRRIEAAKRLLLKPKMPLVEIALACGFADQSHFNNVFSAAVGISPGAWRRARID